MRHRTGPRVFLVAALALLVAAAIAATARAGLLHQQRPAVDVTLYLYFGSNGSGSVTISPPGLTCTDDCRANVAEGSTVKLTATAAAGSSLDNWPNNQCQEQGSALSYKGPTCT